MVNYTLDDYVDGDDDVGKLGENVSVFATMIIIYKNIKNYIIIVVIIIVVIIIVVTIV
jgi:hypothetical protein